MIYPKNQKPPVKEVSGLARLSADPLAVVALLLATSARTAVAIFDVVTFRALRFVMVDVTARFNRMPRGYFHLSRMKLVSDLSVPLYHEKIPPL